MDTLISIGVSGAFLWRAGGVRVGGSPERRSISAESSDGAAILRRSEGAGGEAVAQFRSFGLEPVLLTGDNHIVARRVAAEGSVA